MKKNVLRFEWVDKLSRFEGPPIDLSEPLGQNIHFILSDVKKKARLRRRHWAFVVALVVGLALIGYSLGFILITSERYVAASICLFLTPVIVFIVVLAMLPKQRADKANLIMKRREVIYQGLLKSHGYFMEYLFAEGRSI